MPVAVPVAISVKVPVEAAERRLGCAAPTNRWTSYRTS
jgi:hypothetical protein